MALRTHRILGKTTKSGRSHVNKHGHGTRTLMLELNENDIYSDILVTVKVIRNLKCTGNLAI